MQSNNRIFEDAARLAEGAMGSAIAFKREIEALARAQLERILAGMDLVKRDEFEAAREMAANARAEQEKLAERIAALEAARTEETKPTGTGKPQSAGSETS
ncbi:MAG: accessory factor UbiK family protein [Defluviicoccus sp.]|nr:accessory factor UbiK family protein [Defluviicoccus sp.]